MFDDIVKAILLTSLLLVTGCASQQEPTLKTSFSKTTLKPTSNKAALTAIQDLRSDVKQLRKTRKLSNKSYNSMMKDLVILETRLNKLINANESLREEGFDWNP